jgi:hypothetical protein
MHFPVSHYKASEVNHSARISDKYLHDVAVPLRLTLRIQVKHIDAVTRHAQLELFILA